MKLDVGRGLSGRRASNAKVLETKGAWPVPGRDTWSLWPELSELSVER